ncbi:MAG: glycosyltransferase [Maribacter litoralis]|uniref:glycosyltransferase n=1 Tax=Maribacter litoralis TaxID=2059726 RepID=UPI003299B8F9
MFSILFVLGTYPNYGGTEKVTTVLANELTQKKHKVSIASFEQPRPSLIDEELNKSIDILKLSYPVLKHSNLKLLEEFIIAKEINIIINQWCLPYFVTLLINKARKNHKCSLISVLHGVPNQNKRLLDLLNRKNNTTNLVKQFAYKTAHAAMLWLTGLNLRFVYMHSDQYVVLSKSFIGTFLKLSKISNDNKIKVIANPITIATPNNFNEIITNKEKTILYVGRMDYTNKRVHRIVEAWEEISDKYSKWNLVLVGDGPEKNTLVSYVKSKKIDRIIFEGFKKDAPTEFYKQASILLLTSDLEGFGLVVIESMIYGVVPIVYGSYTAIYDIIEPGKSGFTTPMPYQKTNTVQQIEKLIKNKSLRQKMSKAAHERAQFFSLETIVEEWESLFSLSNSK